MSPRWLSSVLVTLGLVGCADEAPSGAGAAPPPAPPAARGEAGPAPIEAAAPGGVAPTAGVQVGQRYHFRLDEGGARADMVWEITAVTPGEVRYSVSVLKNGVALGPPGESSWSPTPPPAEGEPPPPTADLTTALVAGRSWTCRVNEADGTRTWTAATPAGQDAFPPLLKQSQGGEVRTELLRIEEP